MIQYWSLAISGNLGLDFTPIKSNNNEIKLQFGLLTSYDPLRDEILIVSADNGPSFLFPSVNIQIRIERWKYILQDQYEVVEMKKIFI